MGWLSVSADTQRRQVVAEKTQVCKVDAFGAAQLDFTMKIPEAGDYVLGAALVKGSERPICSVRDFKAAATVSSR